MFQNLCSLHVPSMKFLIAFPYLLFQVYTKSCHKNVIFVITFIDQLNISLSTLPTIGLHTDSPSIIKIATKLSEGTCGGKKKNIWYVK